MEWISSSSYKTNMNRNEAPEWEKKEHRNCLEMENQWIQEYGAERKPWKTLTIFLINWKLLNETITANSSNKSTIASPTLRNGIKEEIEIEREREMEKSEQEKLK